MRVNSHLKCNNCIGRTQCCRCNSSPPATSPQPSASLRPRPALHLTTSQVPNLGSRLAEICSLVGDGKFASGSLVPSLARAFSAFLVADWDEVIAAIEPVMGEHERIGGSRAQRDLVEFTLLKAYLSAGRTDEARAYLQSRRAGSVRPFVARLPVRCASDDLR